jgi:hypothetical protein
MRKMQSKEKCLLFHTVTFKKPFEIPMCERKKNVIANTLTYMPCYFFNYSKFLVG